MNMYCLMENGVVLTETERCADLLKLQRYLQASNPLTQYEVVEMEAPSQEAGAYSIY